jgi:8-oxo-dGTP pyrophosphatase MutT (NUDIX family)
MAHVLRATLLRQLRAHRPADHREGAALVEIVDLLDTHPDPFSRHHLVPGHITASAVLIDERAERVGLIWHAKLGLHLQPGGHVEPGDASVLDAAWRELMEETGLAGHDLELLGDTPIDVDVHDIPARPGEGRHRHFDVRYGFRARHGVSTPHLTWVAPDALGEPNLWRAARKVVRRGLTVAV